MFISEQIQFRLTYTFTNYPEIDPYSQRTGAVVFKKGETEALF